MDLVIYLELTMLYLLCSDQDGIPVNAVFGFTNMLLKLIEDIQNEKGGNVAIAVIFDAARETFRNKIYSQYKANRSDPPEDLKPQFNIIKKGSKCLQS